MALKRIVAVFADASSAEEATYQLARQHIEAKDLAQFHKDMLIQDTDESALRPDVLLGYATSQIAQVHVASDLGAALPPLLSPNTKESKILNRYQEQLASGQIIWTVRVADESVRDVCNMLDHCGAVTTEKL